MYRIVLAATVFAAVLCLSAARAQTPAQAPAEEFLGRVQGDLEAFVMVLPASADAEGDWRVTVTISANGQKVFERATVLAAVETPWAIPIADILRSKSYRFEVSPNLRKLIGETKTALADSISKHGKGNGELEINILPPEDMLSRTRDDVCRSDTPLYFDLLFESDAAGKYVRVDFADTIRNYFGTMLKSSCLVSPGRQGPDRKDTDRPT